MKLKSQDVLIDKIKLYGLTVDEIKDMNLLISKGVVTINGYDPYHLYITKGGDRFSNINIKDTELFQLFSVGYSKHGIYSKLEMTVDYDDYHNLNCYTADMYRKKLIRVKDFLEEEYGICIGIQNASINEIEINKTVPIEHSFEEYKRILDSIFLKYPGTLRLKNECEYRAISKNKDGKEQQRSIETYSRKSGQKGLHVKCYSKTADLRERENIIVDNEYLRFEITLQTSRKINEKLKTKLLSNLSDEKVNAYFNEFIKTNVEQPFKTDMVQRKRKLMQILKHHQKNDNNRWVRYAIEEINNIERASDGITLLYDVDELLEILSKLKFTSDSAKHRAMNTCKKICSESFPFYNNHDKEKYNELISKLGDTSRY